MRHADVLVPRARDNATAIEMVATEVFRRVTAEAARAAAGAPPTPRADAAAASARRAPGM